MARNGGNATNVYKERIKDKNGDYSYASGICSNFASSFHNHYPGCSITLTCTPESCTEENTTVNAELTYDASKYATFGFNPVLAHSVTVSSSTQTIQYPDMLKGIDRVSSVHIEAN